MNAIRSLHQISALCGPVAAARVFVAKVLCRPAVVLPVLSLGTTVSCRLNNSDLVVFLGTFLSRDCVVDLSPPPTLILDLGANVGFTALQFHAQYPSARIVALEPDLSSYELCKSNTAAIPRVAVSNRGVFAHCGKFHLTNPGSIAMSRRFVSAGSAVDQAVDGVNCDGLLDTYAQPHDRILVKMDIEGAEKDIFSKDTRWLNRVHAVLVEPHGEGTKQIIESALSASGFRIDMVGEKILGYRDNAKINSSH